MSDVPDCILKSLYTINKLAKQYGETATSAYHAGFGADAKYKSIRKDALYEYKSKILKELYDTGKVEEVSHHIIDGRDYYCFYIGDYSFHTPFADFEEQLSVGDTRDISDEFESSSECELSSLSETQAIQILDFTFEGSPNECLSQEFLTRQESYEFVGWQSASQSKSVDY